MISTEYLDAEFGRTEPPKESHADAGTLELLKSSIETLTKQLDVKDQQIADLAERQKEQNVLLQGLQKKIPELSSGVIESEPAVGEVVDVVENVKRGWIRRFFHRSQSARSVNTNAT